MAKPRLLMFTICPVHLKFPKCYWKRSVWVSLANQVCMLINVLWWVSQQILMLFQPRTKRFLWYLTFQIGILITGVQNDIKHVRTVHVCTSYFSKSNPTLNIDNLLPYDELELSAIKISPHLIGKDRNLLNLQVIIVPMGNFTCYDTIPFEFK